MSPRPGVLDQRPVIVGVSTFALVTALAPDLWRNSIGWWGYGVVALLVFAASATLLMRHRRQIRWRDIPRPLFAFLILAGLSVAWSFYPRETAIATVLQLITTTVGLFLVLVPTPAEILRVLGRALRIVLVLSLAFELVVALVIRQPVLPVWVTGADRIDPPAIEYWSRNLLLEGDKIQGIVGSSTLLGMLALVALIVFFVQFSARTVPPALSAASLALAGGMLVLSRPATVVLALAVVAAAAVAISIVRRSRSRRRGAAIVASASIILGLLAFLLQRPILALLDKSPDLTGRFDIWNKVIGLAVDRPIFGWGWISFWAPWVEPFRNLVRKAGVVQLHAHNAWLDVWLQLGLVGVAVFGVLIVFAVYRSFRAAVSGGAETLVWPLLLTALLIQSLAESRLLIEGGFVLLVITVVSAKRARMP